MTGLWVSIFLFSIAFSLLHRTHVLMRSREDKKKYKYPIDNTEQLKVAEKVFECRRKENNRKTIDWVMRYRDDTD